MDALKIGVDQHGSKLFFESESEFPAAACITHTGAHQAASTATPIHAGYSPPISTAKIPTTAVSSRKIEKT